MNVALEPICPACAGELDAAEDALRCPGCRRAYPVLAGVADLRLAPDRFLSLEADREKGLRVLDKAGDGGYRAALEAYWELTPELEPELAQGHLKRQLAEADAGAALAREVERRCGPLQGPVLDLGCGLGGFVAAAAFQGLESIGVDAAFRWAVLAKLRLERARVSATVICANAEHPPFRPGNFSLVVANDLLEHVENPRRTMTFAAQMLRTGGRLYVASTNRYSLAPEPHVRLLGVGWLPRSLQSGYVELRRGHAYDKVCPLSGRELQRLTEQAGLRPSQPASAPVFAGHLDAGSRAGLAVLERARWFAPRVGLAASRPGKRS